MSSDLQARLQAALGDAYRLERELARGGMSRLFLATEASLNRQVVVKVLPPDFTSQVSSDRFRQEIELAAHLQHPNILPVLTAGTRENLLYYVIPYVPGESLRHRLTREGRLPVSDAIRVLHEIADAVAYAHAEGVIHRDIKPENILLEGSHAVLTDFGVARALGESRSGGRLTDTGLALGTPGYMAPEQAAGSREIDGRADVYALAVVGYEMLAGAPPFVGPSAQAVIAAHLTATPRPLLDLRPEAPPEAANAIARALAKDPNARLQTAAELRDAIGPAHSGARVRPASRRVILALGAALIAILGGAGALLFRRGSPATLDPTLVAIAPFDVLASSLGLWREGLVDLLSRNLDGAGPLKTVAPSVVIRRWSGRADPPSAIALGRSTGAGLAVIGQLVPTGKDSVRLTATLVDVSTGRSLSDVELRGASGSMDRLSDSLTLALLRGIGETRAVGSVRATAMRATSLPALKAFLQGEQYFRRLAWDSAMASYRRALEADSGFALAYRRMGTVLGWKVIGGDSLSGVYTLRAAALNHGLAPRDSLLIAAESLTTALFNNSDDTLWRSHRARLFSILNDAVQRYPGDPEVWYLVGDSKLHFRQVGRTTLQQELEAFDRAIELDSAYGESYLHPVEIALHLRSPERARQYISGYLKHSGGTADLPAQSFQLVDRLLTGSRGQADSLDSMLKPYSAGVLFNTVTTISHWADSLETTVQVARALVKSPPSGVPLFDNREFRTWWLTAALAYRGRLKEAYEVGPRFTERTSTMAMLGGVPSDSAGALFQRWLREPPIRADPDAVPFGFNINLFDAFPWWAARRDTLALTTMAKRMRSLKSQKPEDIRPWLEYAATSAEAYVALAKGDSADALARFTSLPDTVCPCDYDEIITSQLLSQKGKSREALAVFDGHYPHYMSPAAGLWHLQRARAFEKVGRRDEAIDDYRFTAAVWQHADPELQPYVTEARQALARLTSEPRQ